MAYLVLIALCLIGISGLIGRGDARAASVSNPSISTSGPRLMAVTPSTPRFPRLESNVRMQDQPAPVAKKLNRRPRTGN